MRANHLFILGSLSFANVQSAFVLWHLVGQVSWERALWVVTELMELSATARYQTVPANPRGPLLDHSGHAGRHRNLRPYFNGTRTALSSVREAIWICH